MIRAALFDLDGTLLDRDQTLALFLDQQYARFASRLPGIERGLFIRTFSECDAHGYVSRVDAYGQTSTRLGFSAACAADLVDDFEHLFHPLAIPFPGMHEMLTGLRAVPIGLGLVTNGLIRSQQPKIDSLRLTPYFGSILISEAEGVRKPEPEIYQRAMRQLGAGPEETVFIGDHPEADIGGAARLGLRTIWKRNTCWPPPAQTDAVIDNLGEILPLITAWNWPSTLR